MIAFPRTKPERRARQLLRSCVGDAEWEMYRDLGFVRVDGRPPADAPAGTAAPAYLIYPHRPIVAYEPATGTLLAEYAVPLPQLGEDGSARMPATDDVLAKWMALTTDEGRLLARADSHRVGHRHDPARVRRDLWRLREWDRRRGDGTDPAAGAA